MATLADFRQQYPQYNDMTDSALADSLYSAYYSDMPRDQFNSAIGYSPDGALTNVGRFLATAGARAGGILSDMATHGPQAAIRNALFPDVAKIESDWGNPTDTGFQSANEDLKAMGAEYQPTTPAGRMGLAAMTGALAGAGAGPTAGVMGALSGASGQGAAELGGDSRWQLLASLAPGLLVPAVRSAGSAVLASPETKAIGLLSRTVGKDADLGLPSASDISSKLAGASQPLAIADVAGPNTRGLAEYIANQPDQGGAIANQFLDARDQAAGTRLISATVNPLSSGKTAFQTVQDLQNERAAAAAPFYQQAFAANKNVASPLLDRILQTPAGQQALSGARDRMQNQMTLMGTPDAELMEQAREAGQYIPGGKGVASGLKLQTWDLIKQDIDDQIAQTKRAVISGNARRSQVDDLVSLKQKLVGELDRLDITGQAGPNSTKPGGGLYAQARAAYSGPSQSINAVQLGQDIYGKSPELIQQEMSNLSPSDQDFYRLGAADALRQRISGTSSGGNEALKIVGNDELQQKFRPLFPTQGAYDQFMRAAQNENTMFQTRQRMTGNSATYRRAAQDAMQNGEGGGFAGAVAQAGTGLAAGEPVMTTLGALRGVGSLYKKFAGPNPATNAALARMLFSSDPQTNAATTLALMDYANRARGANLMQYAAPGLLSQPQAPNRGLLAP